MQHYDHDLLQQSILGCLLIWNEEIDKASLILSPLDFTKEPYRIAFQYLIENDGGDLVTVTTALKGKVRAEDLVAWTGLEVTSAFLPRYCQQLKEISRKVQIFDAAGRIRLMHETATSSEMIEAMEAATATVAVRAKREPVDAATLIVDAARRLKERYENRGKIQGVPFGYPSLDAITQGMHPGNLIIIAGRPSMGKTAFALNVAENVSDRGYSVMVFSLEMVRGDLMDRMVASRGGIHYAGIRSGNLSQSEWVKLNKCSDEIKRYKLFIDDTPGISVEEIRRKARHKKKTGLDVLVIDYLQIMAIPKCDVLSQGIGKITMALKVLALELEITIILLSQLNRGLETRNTKRPLLSDLRESGNIEQDADVIIFPYRESVYCEKCKSKTDDGNHRLHEHQASAELIIGKQRNGEANVNLPIVWMGRYQRFEDVTPIKNTIDLD
jgi:replicative DNA helicase